jgi:gamma-glutamyltranspeptidase / glutathione hydrolase
MIALGRVRPILEGELGAVSAAHPLAVSAGVAALLDGGSAADAAIAAQAVLCVLMPEACGLGGDLLALVGEPSGRVTAVNATGRSAMATPPEESVSDGGASVTVPGLVDGWGQLSSRWGRLPLTTTLARARALARHGARVLASTADASSAQRLRLIRGGAADWPIVVTSHGQHLVQPELADLLDGIAADGARWFYEGDPAVAVVRAVQRNGGFLELADLAAHDTPILDSLRVPFSGAQVAVQPPMAQGVLLAMALAWLDGQELPADPSLLDHIGIELTEAVFAYRHRAGLGAGLFSEALDIDRSRARHLGGPRSYLHTAGVATADRDGMVISSLV